MNKLLNEKHILSRIFFKLHKDRLFGPGLASSVAKRSLCNFLASTGLRSIHAHARIFSSAITLTHISSLTSNLQTLYQHTTYRKRKAVVEKEKPAERKEK